MRWDERKPAMGMRRHYSSGEYKAAYEAPQSYRVYTQATADIVPSLPSELLFTTPHTFEKAKVVSDQIKTINPQPVPAIPA